MNVNALIFSFSFSFCPDPCIALCPSDCSAHGTCVTMADMSVLKGPDYLAGVQLSGDGLGIRYENWDAASVTLCDCDAGFFGADCSLVMCPKGDDPWTKEQNDRQIGLVVLSNDSAVPLGGC